MTEQHNLSNEQFLRLPEVKKIVPLSTSRIYALISEGRFPKPHKISVRAVVWKFSDIQAYIQNLKLTEV